MEGFIPRKECVFIPVGSERGDCPYCDSGVLVRDYETEKQGRYIKEQYQCDTCGRTFIEGMNTVRTSPWTRHYKGYLHRYFIDADLIGLSSY